jgi:hypothetical protein
MSENVEEKDQLSPEELSEATGGGEEGFPEDAPEAGMDPTALVSRHRMAGHPHK